jgi:hypothetical protein
LVTGFFLSGMARLWAFFLFTLNSAIASACSAVDCFFGFAANHGADGLAGYA